MSRKNQSEGVAAAGANLLVFRVANPTHHEVIVADHEIIADARMARRGRHRFAPNDVPFLILDDQLVLSDPHGVIVAIGSNL